jgi:methylmalonyl-CoA mutase
MTASRENAPEPPALLGFSPPPLEQWRALVQASLKGAPFEQLRSTTADGIVIEPLYHAEADAPTLAARAAPSNDPDRPWDLRAVVEHPDPARAAEQAREALEGGAASILLRIDPTGRDGVIVHDQDSLARALAGVMLDAAPVALDAGFLGPRAGDWLSVAAKGAPAARLGFHFDPLSAFAETGASPGPVAAHLSAAAQTAARHAGAYPKATFFLASGRAAHEAGGSEGQELGLMAASALAYAKAGVEAGMSMAQAFQGVVLGLSVDQAYLEGVAKLRAARAIWARLVEACGVKAEARIEARASRRMLSALDPWTNLLRLTAAGFAGGVAGAEAVVLEPFTRPLGAPTDFARRQARNIQLVLMQEASLGRVADPAGGAWYLERLTDQLARAGWTFFQEIEAKGGAAAALESGFVAEAVARVRTERPQAAIVGASHFPARDQAPVAVDPLETRPAARDLELRMPGDDSRCPPLTPIRLSQPFEEAKAQ